jgi:uncharacterized ferritin-like protein (DUF455 family)
MKKSLFTELYSLLTMSKEAKVKAVPTLLKALMSGELDITHEEVVHPIAPPTYQNLTTVVRPDALKKRSALHTLEGKANFLHAITHIEFAAIDLALDAAYRFRHLPLQYYIDWLEVADDEVRHFLMLETILNEMGYYYGDFPVHSGLFEAAERSLTLLDRMAVVPRYLEANGLDANPKMIQKMQNVKGPFSQEIVQALNIILEEEIIHVQKGDTWFSYACEKENVSKEIYFEAIERIIPGSSKAKPNLNIEARKAAGFSCKELKTFNKNISCETT